MVHCNHCALLPLTANLSQHHNHLDLQRRVGGWFTPSISPGCMQRAMTGMRHSHRPHVANGQRRQLCGAAARSPEGCAGTAGSGPTAWIPGMRRRRWPRLRGRGRAVSGGRGAGHVGRGGALPAAPQHSAPAPQALPTRSPPAQPAGMHPPMHPPTLIDAVCGAGHHIVHLVRHAPALGDKAHGAGAVQLAGLRRGAARRRSARRGAGQRTAPGMEAGRGQGTALQGWRVAPAPQWRVAPAPHTHSHPSSAPLCCPACRRRRQS